MSQQCPSSRSNLPRAAADLVDTGSLLVLKDFALMHCSEEALPSRVAPSIQAEMQRSAQR
eukprot:519509-Amphidinium_carterae.3